MSKWFEKIAQKCIGEIEVRPEWLKQKVQATCPCCGVIQLVTQSIKIEWETKNDTR